MKLDYIKLRKITEERGLKRNWIANQLGISPRSITAYYTGISTPRMPVVKLLAQILKVKEEDLCKEIEAS